MNVFLYQGRLTKNVLLHYIYRIFWLINLVASKIKCYFATLYFSFPHVKRTFLDVKCTFQDEKRTFQDGK